MQRFIVALLTGLLPPSAEAGGGEQPAFVPLGNLDASAVPPGSFATGLSSDGSVVVGSSFVMPAGVPFGTELWWQFGIADVAAVAGVSLSNALLGTTP